MSFADNKFYNTQHKNPHTKNKNFQPLLQLYQRQMEPFNPFECDDDPEFISSDEEGDYVTYDDDVIDDDYFEADNSSDGQVEPDFVVVQSGLDGKWQKFY